MGKMCRVLEGRGVEGISEMAQEAQQEIGGGRGSEFIVPRGNALRWVLTVGAGGVRDQLGNSGPLPSRLARSYSQARSSHLRAAIASLRPSADSAGWIRCRRRGSTVRARASPTKLIALSGSVDTSALAVRSANSSSVNCGAPPHINHTDIRLKE
jgi:hypothetical protein